MENKSEKEDEEKNDEFEFIERKKKILSLIAPVENFNQKCDLNFKFEGIKCPIHMFYSLIFSDKKLDFKGKSYRNFWEYLKVEKMGDNSFSSYYFL